MFGLKVTARDSKLSWVAWCGCLCISISTIGFMSCFSIFYSLLLSEFNESKEKTAWVGSIPMSLTFLLAPFSSLTVKKFGIKLSTIFASLLIGTSFLLTSLTKDLDLIFLTYSLLFGIGCSIVFMIETMAVNTYFDKNLATAFGALHGCTALFQIGLAHMINTLLSSHGLQTTFQIFAAMFTVLGLVSAQAFLPTNYVTCNDVKVESRKKGFLSYISLLKNKALCIWIVAHFITSLEFAVSTVHQVQFAIEFGVAEKSARQYPLYTAISAGLGRITTGFIFDQNIRDKVYLYQAIMFTTGLISFVGSLSTSHHHLMAYIWIFSFADGLFQSSCFPVLRTLIGFEHLSESISIMLFVEGFSIVLGPPIVGLIADKTKNYKSFFYVAGSPLIIGCLMLLALRCVKIPKQENNAFYDLEITKEKTDEKLEFLDNNNSHNFLQLETTL